MTFIKIAGAIRRNLLRVAIPLTKIIGKLHSPFSHKLIHAKEYRDFAAKAEVGSVFLTKTFGELSGPLIPGYFKHGAIYVGNGLVVEATMAGVHSTDLIDFLMTKDVVALVRPLFANEDQRKAAALWALTQVGAPYDYEFKSDNKAFYCFELTYASYKEAMGEASPWELREVWGEPTVVSEDFLEATTKWQMVADTRIANALGGIL